jgi:hypothetical protein
MRWITLVASVVVLAGRSTPRGPDHDARIASRRYVARPARTRS